MVQITRPDGSSFPANRYVGSQSGERPELVLYWFQAHGRAVASEYQAKYYLISDSIHMNRSDGALVRLSLQLRVLGFGLLQDGYVGVGVFPQREEILVVGQSLGARSIGGGSLV